MKRDKHMTLQDLPHNAQDGFEGLTLLGLLDTAVQNNFTTLQQLVCTEIGNRRVTNNQTVEPKAFDDTVQGESQADRSRRLNMLRSFNG
tara:strand:- start:269 stop:535 length:267 start_codon:yes stop_codon:yes gene_type:complete